MLIPKSNFKKKKSKKGKRGHRDGDDGAYIAAIHGLPCFICLRFPVEAHHLRGHQLGRGMGLKSLDRWALPLCNACHTEAHVSGTKLEVDVLDGKTGFSVLGMAKDLYATWLEHGTLQSLEETFWSYYG